MTWYVTRNQGGGIAAAYQYQMDDLPTEALADDNPELLAFFAPPVVVPAVISDRQFFQMLALAGTITQAEALDAVKVGAIPPTLAAFVAAIPDEGQRFAAEMLLSGATEFRRDHPLVEAVGAAQGMTSADIDAFWISASAL